MMTREEKKAVEKLKNDPNIEFKQPMSDEEILAQTRFVEDGEGLEVYNSVEEWRRANKKHIDEIEER